MTYLAALEMRLDWTLIGQAAAAWLVVFGMLWRLGKRITGAGRNVVTATKANTAALVRLDHRIELLESLERRRLDRAERDDAARPPRMGRQP